MLLVLMRCTSVVIPMTKSSYFGRALICPSGQPQGFDLTQRTIRRYPSISVLGMHRRTRAVGPCGNPDCKGASGPNPSGGQWRCIPDEFEGELADGCQGCVCKRDPCADFAGLRA